ncbi:MAG: Asp-tRNA(Asn)/Glu-tRNA(Gln) amidotransferase subunit GatC [Chitinophagaceae bacterium]|nr:Asp-tRNA(Asn)/Glu-tRNA(Gln) amidotransferase subunit GatC [Chitinophagaceae bacterium]
MQVTPELIDRLAHLSMLSFTEEEKLVLQSELEKMLGFINKLQEVDTTGVKPAMHIAGGIPFSRNDEVRGELPASLSFKNAPSHDDTYFKVPKVIKK